VREDPVQCAGGDADELAQVAVGRAVHVGHVDHGGGDRGTVEVGGRVEDEQAREVHPAQRREVRSAASDRVG